MCIYIIYMTNNLHRKIKFTAPGTLRVLIYILRVLIFANDFLRKDLRVLVFANLEFFLLIAYNLLLQYPYKIIITLRLFL